MQRNTYVQMYIVYLYTIAGDDEYWHAYSDVLQAVKYNLRTGRKACAVDRDAQQPLRTARKSGRNGTACTFVRDSAEESPLYVNVDMLTGVYANSWVDSLAAAFGSVLTLGGDVDEAICLHAVYDAIWRKYGVLPDRYNWQLNAPDVKFYPLRPEFVETTYHLYRATRNPYYLHVGKRILESLNNHTKARCGYATVHDVTTMTLEDRMESFFLSETCKYLYLVRN